MQREITRELVRRLLPGRMAESNKEIGRAHV